MAVYRPGLRRWATVAKLVPLDGELVLAVPYRHRRRLQGRLSLPLAVVRYAQEKGAANIVVRLDDERRALRISLDDALRVGAWGAVDGRAELWLRLEGFTEAPGPDWPYATDCVRLGPGPDDLPRQLALGLEVQP